MEDKVTLNGKTLYSKRISGGKSRNYFVDVRQSEKGNKYLVVAESRIAEGSWTTQRVVVFSDHVGEWKQTLDEAIMILGE